MFQPIHILPVGEEKGAWIVSQQDRFEYSIRASEIYHVVRDMSFKRVVYSPMYDIIGDLLREGIHQENVDHGSVKKIKIECVDFFDHNDPRNEYILFLDIYDRLVAFPFNFWVYHRAGMLSIDAEIERNNQMRFRERNIRAFEGKGAL